MPEGWSPFSSPEQEEGLGNSSCCAFPPSIPKLKHALNHHRSSLFSLDTCSLSITFNQKPWEYETKIICFTIIANTYFIFYYFIILFLFFLLQLLLFYYFYCNFRTSVLGMLTAIFTDIRIRHVLPTFKHDETPYILKSQ